MSTDARYARLYNKKILPLDMFKDEFLDYMREGILSGNADAYREDAVFDATIPVIAGGVNNSISVAGAFKGVTGTGWTIDIDALDDRFQDVTVPPDAAASYHIGVEANIAEVGIEINPRTSEAEYVSFKELVGRKGVPNSVVDNLDGTVTLVINSITESGKNYTGRSVRVWLKSRQDGGIGPLARTEADAIETCAITYSAPNNRITTAGLLGQDEADVSTTAADYVIMLEGPTVMRAAAEDLRTTEGVLFLAAVTSVAAANPIVTISTTDQNVLDVSIGGMLSRLSTAVNEMTRSGIISGMGHSEASLNFTVASGVYWMQGKRITFAGDVVAITDASTRYVYIDTDGDLKSTASLSTATTLPRLVLYRVTAAAGAITLIEDVRRYWTRMASRAFVTAGGFNCDFTTLEAAVLWADINSGSGDDSPFKIIVQGDLTVGSTIEVNDPVHIEAANRGTGHITGPAGAYVFHVNGSVDRCVFRDLFVLCSTAAGGGFLDLTDVTNADFWEINGCTLAGGRDVDMITTAGHTGGTGGWKVHNNLFTSMAHTSGHSSLTFEGLTDSQISFNIMNGGTGDAFDAFMALLYGSSNNRVFGNRATTGGLAYTAQDSNAAASLTAATSHNSFYKNRGAQSRTTSMSVKCTGPTYIDDNEFIDCMTASSGTNGVLEIAGSPTTSRAVLSKNKFIDWATGAAISVDAGSSIELDHNILDTDEAAVVLGITINADLPMLRIVGNYIDLSRGASAGSGKAAGVGIDGGGSDNATISGNNILNVGSAGSPSGGVVTNTNGDNCVYVGNILFNCRGTGLVQGTGCVVSANQYPDDTDEFLDSVQYTIEERSIGASDFEIHNGSASHASDGSGLDKVLSGAAGVILYAAIEIPVGSELTEVTVWNKRSGGTITIECWNKNLSAGTSARVGDSMSVAAGTSRVGTSITSIAGDADRILASGHSFNIYVATGAISDEIHGATVKWKRPRA